MPVDYTREQIERLFTNTVWIRGRLLSYTHELMIDAVKNDKTKPELFPDERVKPDHSLTERVK